MKNPQIQPTAVEKVMRENDFIVSKTDTRTASPTATIFIEFSGYSRPNCSAPSTISSVIPTCRGVFKFLWDNIAAGNRSLRLRQEHGKDGSFYWVFANVTPDYDAAGRISGYLSVRRAPKRSAVQVVDGLYRAMLEAERKGQGRRTPAMLRWRCWSVY